MLAISKSVTRFNLAEILRSLELTQRQFNEINNLLNVPRSPLTDEEVDNMVEGYRFVDQLLADGTDLMARGNSHHLLEINTLVLCGIEHKNREEFAFPIQLSKEYFYDRERGNVAGLMEWSDLHADDDIWMKAAGMYVHILSRPQLFFEGNHRSATLIISFLLGRAGLPPFVLTPANAKPLLDQSKQLSDLKKSGFNVLFRFPRLRKHVASILPATLEQRHLL